MENTQQIASHEKTLIWFVLCFIVVFMFLDCCASRSHAKDESNYLQHQINELKDESSNEKRYLEHKVNEFDSEIKYEESARRSEINRLEHQWQPRRDFGPNAP